MKFVAKCISGPYWLPDVYKEEGHVDEVFGYDCTLNGSKIVMGEDNIDGGYYVQVADDETYNLYIKYIETILPLFNNAIEAYKLKQSLSKETAKTFEDIIDEL